MAALDVRTKVRGKALAALLTLCHVAARGGAAARVGAGGSTGKARALQV
jgi:hypothetical protein